jgi:NAD+ synthase (glutamine-hydrolysing)
MTAPVRIALAQFQPRKGSYPANVARIRELLGQVAALDEPPHVFVLPETALSGYFVEGGVEEVAVTAGQLAADLDRAWRAVASGGAHIHIVVGFYERWEHTLHNSAAYIQLGGSAGGSVLHVHRKIFLPTYGLFDEHRFTEPGLDIRAFDAPWGRAAMLVCEDAWHSLSGTIAALDGAQVVFICSAAPARGVYLRESAMGEPASVARWERLIREVAAEHGLYAAYCNLVGTEGGKSFQGGSLIIGPQGDVRARGPTLEEAIIVAEIDLDDLSRARADAPLLADLRSQLPHLQRELARAASGVRGAPARFDAARRDTLRSAEMGSRHASREDVSVDSSRGGVTRGRAPSAGAASGGGESDGPRGEAVRILVAPEHGHGAPPPLDIDGPLLERWLTTFIREELARRSYSDVIVALSGGVDSAVAAALGVRALGTEHVHAVCMPYRTSHPDSLAHAHEIARALGIDARTIDITPAADGYLANEPDADATRRGNVMARVRMIALFDLSAKLRALPLGTSNKTERLLGYFTWHADDSPPINPLGDLFKTQIWALARHLELPEFVITKRATADLVAGQTDEGDLGVSYARADEILNWLIHGWTADEIAARGYDADDVATVKRRLDSTHWKRRPPTVAMVSGSAIGESYLRPVDY